jgi:hypothetical protein
MAGDLKNRGAQDRARQRQRGTRGPLLDGEVGRDAASLEGRGPKGWRLGGRGRS